MMIGLLILMGLVIVILMIGNLFTAVLQDFFLFRPRKLDNDYEFQFESEFEELFFDTPDGARINALWFKKKNNLSKRVVLYFHGNSGDLSRWGKLHHTYQKYGCDFFVYDYRGFGKSKGNRAGEASFHDDAEHLYRFLLKYYKPDQFVIIGRSLGTGVATRLASKHQPSLVILETPYHSIKNLFYTYYPFLPRWFAFKFRFENHKYISEIKSSVYIIHGDKDIVIPYRCAVRLKLYLQGENNFILIKGAKHNNLFLYKEYNNALDYLMTHKID